LRHIAGALEEGLDGFAAVDAELGFSVTGWEKVVREITS
jgi:hypothetical protein